MKKIYTFLALTAGLLFAATACVNISENNDIYRQPGTPIVFSASAGYQNGVETKAEYSGYYYGSPSYERIDWVANDPVKIVYNGTPASYTVATVSGTTSEISDATLGSGSLTWDGNNTHVFYGLYPAGAAGSSGTLTNAGQVSGSIPAVQDINASKTITDQDNITKYQPDTEHYGYLVAFKEIAASSTESTVVLPFRPAVTTFEFKFQRLSGDTYPNNIQSFTLSTQAVGSNPATPLSGDFQFQITGGDSKGATWSNVSTSSTGNSITVGFGAGGVAIPSTGFLDFSILALPTDITGATMTVTYVGGATKSLKLKTNGGNDWYTFTGAKKYVITNTVPGDEVWHYVIEEIDDQTFVGHTSIDPISYNVKSYKYSDRDPGTKVPVTWKTQYSLDGGSTWADVTASNTPISGTDYTISSAITGSGVSTSTYSAGEARSAKLNGSTTPSGDTEHSPSTIVADLASRSPKGTTSSPYDLSMYDIFGNPHSQTTANSYIITAPGTYKFPVVYGNGITNGDTDYTEAFWPASDGTDVCGASAISSIYADHKNETTFRYLHRYKTLAGGGIASASIIDDFATWENAYQSILHQSGVWTLQNPNAAIVWQNRMELYTGEAPGPIIQESSVSYANGYITFTVRPEDIRPGNVVIAFRAGVGTNNQTYPANTILWSWQIWITADDLTPVEVPGGALLPYNLGYIDSTGAGTMTYPNRLIKFRIVQEEDGTQHETEDFTIEQIGDGRSWDASIGFNVYYQWGRKDPMIPAKDYGATTQTPPAPATGTRQVYPDAAIYPGTGYTINVGGDDIAGGFYGQAGPDYARGISTPYRAFLNTLSTGWIGGYVNGYLSDVQIPTAPTNYQDEEHRKNSAIPVNLWNNGMHDTMDGTSDKWKTIYDPCPPGFCVPTVGVFSSLTTDNIIGRNEEGVYFGANNGKRLFMPYAGLRVFYNQGNGHAFLWAEEVRNSGFYWTDSTFGKVGGETPANGYYYSKCFSFGRTSINPTTSVGASMSYTKGSSLAIRPMVDPKYAPSSGPSPAASMGGGSIPNVGNGGEIPGN